MTLMFRFAIVYEQYLRIREYYRTGPTPQQGPGRGEITFLQNQ